MEKQVMVVDDDMMNLRMAEMFLSKRGYKVKKAASGEECLELLGEENVDLILLDVEMPGMGGIEVLDKIREHESWSAIPVLFLSASEDIEEKVADSTCKADGFIKKPFLPSVLIGQVEKFIG